MRTTIILFLALVAAGTSAQPRVYTTAQVHSHNDYEQHNPFYLAWEEALGSMEADIFLVNGALLVAHDGSELRRERTLQAMYLEPLSACLSRYEGSPYPDRSLRLQLLIDVKSEAESTLKRLIEALNAYPSITRNNHIRIVITGNRPAEEKYVRYPAFIHFDGRPGMKYLPAALSRIALISEDFTQYSSWKGDGPLPEADRNTLKGIVDQAHALNKPIRFWASPDNTMAWEELIKLQVDYLNTDRIQTLGDFLRQRNDAVRILPFDRYMNSAGKVIRYGNPAEENHALDADLLEGNDLAVIEDRYGIAAISISEKKIRDRWTFLNDTSRQNLISTYSGIQVLHLEGRTWVVWGASARDNAGAAVMIAEWDAGFHHIESIPIEAKAPASNAIPNSMRVSIEHGEAFLYVALNGNNQLQKYRWKDRSLVWSVPTGEAPYGITISKERIYLTNWAGPTATDSTRERAGTPWGLVYTNPVTGATASGTVDMYESSQGIKQTSVAVGLHPNAIIHSADGRFIYVANGSSDMITVLDANTLKTLENIPVGLTGTLTGFQGSTPNALALNESGNVLLVANGLDNAVALVKLGEKASLHGKGPSRISGRIPTEAYPGGLLTIGNHILVTNLESEGANVLDPNKKAHTIHQQLASVSIIPIPDQKTLDRYTLDVAKMNVKSRLDELRLTPRHDVRPVPVPQRTGEPSVFRHVVYIIKENKTYDQVFGDLPQGEGDSSLCVFGEKATPNQHALARRYGLMDQYFASGKSSAEGHQWTDAGMVSDYVEKNVRAWLRSYPHRQEDALVYNKSGFIWNHALDHGKRVRVYGEACTTVYDPKLGWKELFNRERSGIVPDWYNRTTIARLRPIISPDYPDCDNITFSDQQRADIFIRDWHQFESRNDLPDLMLLSLPDDHTTGMSPGFPTPDAMVADNDLALGRIVETITHSRYWDSTVIFITQDDPQSGWDHLSPYRTIGLVISPHPSGKLVSTRYSQVSMLRTIELILGLPPMNLMDATARPMFDCFSNGKDNRPYTALPNLIPLDRMNANLNGLQGKAWKMAKESMASAFRGLDNGDDDRMNRIIWFYTKGDIPYPANKTK